MLSDGLTSFSMQVFNRWGQLIFETKQTDGRGWDGKFNDVPQPQGVFVYIIEASFADGRTEKYQGNVTLLR
jgi:gliding motility-associated-like protein